MREFVPHADAFVPARRAVRRHLPARCATLRHMHVNVAIDGAAPPRRLRLGFRTLLTIVLPFWVYVAASNVLYAHSFNGGLASMMQKQVFAPPSVRVLQHLLLLPLLIGAYAASLRLGWRPPWRRFLPQLLLGVGFAVLAYPALGLAEHLLGTEEMAHAAAGKWMPGPLLDAGDVWLWLASATTFLLTYGFGLALLTGFALYRHSRDTELQVAALERTVHATRLAALRMQLSPHTLFNLLHTIRGQISFDPRAAQAMVVQLADLLRRLLSAGERDLSRLSEELQLVRSYLELQQQRFADRLSIELPPADAVPELWVPSLVLYPLAENAIVHGLAGHEGAVRVRIELQADAQELRLRVINTLAPGRAPAGEGIGLRNLRERLAVQFGERAVLQAGPEGAAWVAEIRMPRLGESP